MNSLRNLSSFLPILSWRREYNRQTFSADITAAVIVTVMLIPQSLAYALLAGLPPEVGLYASIAPLILYAILGSSRVLAVGPVAVVSLMTASTVAQHAAIGSHAYWQIAITLAFLSGSILFVLGLLRFGAIANYLSHPVISGFISASALLIALGQLKTIFGINFKAENVLELFRGLIQQSNLIHALTAVIGLSTVALLLGARRYLYSWLQGFGLQGKWAQGVTRSFPAVIIAVTILLAWSTNWQTQGVPLVGEVPRSLPPLTLPLWDLTLWQSLLMPALLISLVGFVESVSVGQTLAAKTRQRIDPDQELIALGGANVSSALTGGFPVTGGFARSVVNYDAGAVTPAAGAFTAVGIVLASLFLTPALFYIPKATLAATIIVAVLSLVDIHALKSTWNFSKLDFIALLTSLLGTLLLGIERGLLLGVLVSLALFLFRASRPHIAIIGLMPGTQHFRNAERHAVLMSSRLLFLRVDASLFFANSRFVEDRINAEVAARPELEHVILQFSAVNDIDFSALESLQTIARRLEDSGITLHLSELKGPVFDKLKLTDFFKHFSGRVFLSSFEAMKTLSTDIEQSNFKL